ncbi:hypothetical protein A2U01_0073306, partial [Trifolium medium]|nr:hypothetical protein [Trifolium medium]
MTLNMKSQLHIHISTMVWLREGTKQYLTWLSGSSLSKPVMSSTEDEDSDSDCNVETDTEAYAEASETGSPNVEANVET